MAIFFQLKKKFNIFIIFFFISLIYQPLHAGSIIRDAEIESLLREITDPILKSAGLNPGSVKIFIVNDNSINAFVSGGQNIFINTGLMSLSHKPDMLIGVIAHEVGHISGGHLIRSYEEYENAALKSAAGFLLGVAATLAGSPDAGTAIILGTNHITGRQFLKFNRNQEEAADQAAISVLNKLNYSTRGLLELLNILYNKENSLYTDLNPYILTHPLSSERINHIKANLRASGGDNVFTRNNLYERYNLAITKLKAFTSNPKQTIEKYTNSNSTQALYAKSIAYYRLPDINKSTELINILINNFPQNPYYHELKGQILFENGHIIEAIDNYKAALNLMPYNALMKLELANAYLASEDNQFLKEAIENLEQAGTVEPRNIFIKQQLAVAYGRNNQLGLSHLASAEKSLLMNNKKDAELFIERAAKYIPDENSKAGIKLKDLSLAVKNAK